MTTISAQPAQRPLLGRGNRKLGKRIFTFSLPAVSTCPGRTKTCEGACYARRGYMALQKACFERNLKSAKRSDFVDRVVREIGRRPKIVRIHVSGDFFSDEYVRKWIEIAKKAPHARFYTYSRSWRVPEMRKSLERLAALPNVRMWFSVDRESGHPDKVPSTVRIAYMSMNDADRPGKSDLVFRVRRQSVMKRMDGRIVCPVENGVSFNTTCDRCSLCVTKDEAKDPRRFSLPMVG